MLSPLTVVDLVLHPASLPRRLRSAAVVAARTLRPTEGARANAEQALVEAAGRRAARREAAAARASGPGSWRAQAPGSATCHGVTLPDSDEDLVDALTGYVLEGLARGEHCVVLATAAHRHALRSRLTSAGWSTEAGKLLVEVDAEAALEGVLPGGHLDAGAFTSLVVEHVLPYEASGVRVYGELVDLLQRRGALPLALELERLWDGALHGRRFPLLCGYLLGAEEREAREAVLRGHTHVQEQAA